MERELTLPFGQTYSAIAPTPAPRWIRVRVVDDIDAPVSSFIFLPAHMKESSDPNGLPPMSANFVCFAPDTTRWLLASSAKPSRRIGNTNEEENAPWSSALGFTLVIER